ARLQSGAVQAVAADPPRAQRCARRLAPGLRAHGARQGFARRPGGAAACAEEHHAAHRHRDRAGVRLAGRFRGGDGNDLRVAGRRQAPHRRHQCARPAGGRRIHAADGAAVRADQLRGRCALHRARSTRATGGEPMNALRRFGASRLALIAATVLALLVFVAVFAPVIAPQDPYDLAQLDVMEGRLPPGAASLDQTRHYWLGTDEQGRDMLSAIFYGLRSSLYVGVTAPLCALALGSILGVAAGYFGGWFESVAMRVVDIQLSFPAILIALILIAVLGQGVEKVIIALIAVQWAYYARTARSAAVVEGRKEYVEAAVCQGLRAGRIVFRHL